MHTSSFNKMVVFRQRYLSRFHVAEWTPEDYPDQSQAWKDSVLVASKPKTSAADKIRSFIYAAMLRQMSGAGTKV